MYNTLSGYFFMNGCFVAWIWEVKWSVVPIFPDPLLTSVLNEA